MPFHCNKPICIVNYADGRDNAIVPILVVWQSVFLFRLWYALWLCSNGSDEFVRSVIWNSARMPTESLFLFHERKVAVSALGFSRYGASGITCL